MAALLILLAACRKVPSKAITDGKLDINKYISSLSDKRTAHLKDKTKLLLHPLKDAIALYGDNYEFICEGSYAEVVFPKAQCSFEVYIGPEFEKYSGINLDEYNVTEYLAFAQIHKVVFNQKGTAMTDGISIGMSAAEISEKFNESDCLDFNTSFNRKIVKPLSNPFIMKRKYINSKEQNYNGS